MKKKEKPVICPYCEVKVPRPKGNKGSDTLNGTCECGAIYVADETGKNGGQALLDGLVRLCDGDQDRAMELERGVDYQEARFGYRPRTHALEERMPKKGGAYGTAKIWFFKLGAPAAGE